MPEAAAKFRRLLDSDAQAPAELLFGGEQLLNGHVVYRRAPLSNGVDRPLLSLIRSWQEEFGRGASGPIPIPRFDAAVDASYGEVQHIGQEDDQVLAAALADIPAAADAEEWSPGDPLVPHPRAIVLSVRVLGNRMARFIQLLPPKKELQSKGVVVHFVGSHFNALEDSETILLDHSFDCVLYDGEIFVLKQRNFEILFNYLEALQANAAQVLDGASRFFDPIEFRGLKEGALKNRVALRKLRGGTVNLGSVTASTLRSYVRRFHLHILVNGRGQSLKLRFSSEHQGEVIRLLTDAYLTSQITGTGYLATSKRAV